jgi:hypothetical protein
MLPTISVSLATLVTNRTWQQHHSGHPHRSRFPESGARVVCSARPFGRINDGKSRTCEHGNVEIHGSNYATPVIGGEPDLEEL